MILKSTWQMMAPQLQAVPISALSKTITRLTISPNPKCLVSRWVTTRTSASKDESNRSKSQTIQESSNLNKLISKFRRMISNQPIKKAASRATERALINKQIRINWSKRLAHQNLPKYQDSAQLAAGSSIAH